MGKYTSRNDVMHIRMLIVNSVVFALGLKFALFIRSMAADAISPTTTGLSPEKIALIVPLSRCRAMKWDAYSTIRNDGITTARVHAIAPSIPQTGPEKEEGETIAGAE